MTESELMECWRCGKKTQHILVEENRSPESKFEDIVLSVWRCQICMKEELEK